MYKKPFVIKTNLPLISERAELINNLRLMNKKCPNIIDHVMEVSYINVTLTEKNFLPLDEKEKYLFSLLKTEDEKYTIKMLLKLMRIEPDNSKIFKEIFESDSN